jgi:penicillin G amidase
MAAKKSLLGSVARFAIKGLSRRRLPKVEGEIKLAGLNAPVEILRDSWGIPHIYAQSTADALYAQGFVQAQDRLFQMELNRRTGQGTLSELFGELALDTDRIIRTFGFHRLGKVDWENASRELKDGILAYTAGVNAFLEHPKTKLPLEFSLIGHKPAAWTPQDSMGFTRVMMWQLSHAWQGEIIRAEIIEKVGVEHAAELEIHYPEDNPLTLPKGIEFNPLALDGSLSAVTGPFLARGKGSNAWTVAPGRSETGNAVLCNDMHLALSMPSLWYEMHLDAGDDLHVSGVTLPGVPMVLVGHNARIAWGMTLAYTDAEDLFIEQVNSKNQYLYQDEWRDAEILEEPITVKGRKEPHIEQVMLTHHGPIISDVVGDADQRLAVNSMALRPSPAFDGWLRLNQAANWNDFVEAVGLIHAPQLNVAYADVENNIGYWVTGKVPVRAKGLGNVPVPGWSGEYEWMGVVPFEEMPHALNPEAGYTISCNHKIVPDDYPHHLGSIWMNGYRARRLTELIEGQDQLSLQDHQKFHVDVKCHPALALIAVLKDFSDPDDDVNWVLKLLGEWDGYLTPESVPGTLYEVLRYTLVRNLFEPGLGVELATRFMGEGFHPVLNHSNEFYGQDTVILLRLLENPDSWWVQQVGGQEAWIKESMLQAVAWLRERLGPDPEGWQWGKIHQANFEHPLGLQKPLDQVFNRGPFPIGGDTDTPCQTAMSPTDPYDNRAWSPTFRQVVDMGDLSRSVVIVPPGQSENVSSPHYDDLIQAWLDGDYHPMLWTREQVEAAAQYKLDLLVE